VNMFDVDKTRMIELPYGEKNCDNMLSRFHPIPERDGRTDGQNCYINIARYLSVIDWGLAKNVLCRPYFIFDISMQINNLF